MLRIEWKPAARVDLMSLVDFIAEDSPTNAALFAADLRLKVQQLSIYPEMYRLGRKRGTREMVVHPNYIVIYRVLKKSEVIEILRVKHAAERWPTTSGL